MRAHLTLLVSLLAVVVPSCAVESPPELASSEQATTVCGGSATVKGMDVSVYETSIDWAAAKAAGIQFAFIRATDGTQYLDPSFAGYWAGARAAGITRGAYQFFRPDQDPIAQADLMLTTMGTLAPGDLPPVIDVEMTGGLTPAQVATNVTAWVEHVQTALGRTPIIYAGFYSWQDDVGGANLSTYPLWHAQYTTDPCPNIPVPWTAWTFWQYSSTGTVPMVEGETTDLDVFNGDLSALQAFAANGPTACGTIDTAGGEVDNTDACFAAGGPAATLRDVTTAGEGGSLVWTHATDAATEGNFAQWDLDFAASGTYRVDVYTAAPYAQSKSAHYVVDAAGSAQTVTIDQSAVDGWQTLGTFAFAAGGNQYVHLGDDTGETGDDIQLVFDAVRVTNVDPNAGGDGSGSGSDDGGGDDDGSGVTHSHVSGACAAGGREARASFALVMLALAAVLVLGRRRVTPCRP